MRIMKKAKFATILVVGLIVLLLTAVLIRSFNHRVFKPGADRWASSSYDNANLVSIENLGKLKTNVLIVDLDGHYQATDAEDIMRINASEMLERNNLKRIRKFNGSVVLVSGNTALNARLWMLLSQMGISNVYILK